MESEKRMPMNDISQAEHAEPDGVVPPFRFSLRTLLVVVTVVAIFMGSYRIDRIDGEYRILGFSCMLLPGLWLLFIATRRHSIAYLGAAVGMLLLAALFGVLLFTTRI